MAKANKKIARKYVEPQVVALSQVRHMAILYVRQDQFLASHVKDIAEDAVRRHIGALSQELAGLELAVRRTQQGKFTA